MNADGTAQTRLTTDPANDDQPSWSPDGTKIAFHSYRDGSSEIYSMNADGTAQTRLTTNSNRDLNPSWSPDGTKIAFVSDRTGYGDASYEIYSMNADGTDQTRLTSNGTSDDEPSWSPDGTKITFTTYRGNWEIYSMNTDGTGQTNVTSNGAGDYASSWSPDGTRIAFVSGRTGGLDIYSMNADGTGQTRLTTDPAYDYGPDWQPDADSDGVLPPEDNCPLNSNSGQENNDGDAQGDVCDPDDDNDGVADGTDNCPLNSNTGQENNDGDAQGDVCDPDDDNDGVADGSDNCPLNANPGQDNNDGDSLGDACDPDDDNDGVSDASDACPTTFGFADRQGCPVGDANLVELHVVNQNKSGACPGGAGSCKSPIAAAEVRVFDRNNAAFQTAYGSNPSGTIYNQVFENDIGRVGACTTDAAGQCTAGEEATGYYLVIVKFVDGSKTVYTGKPKSPSDFVGGLATKDFQVLKVIRKDGSVQYSGGSKTVVSGSYLEIVYPEFAVWEDMAAGYVYPFIFTSDSGWSVDVCAYVPRGYAIVGVYDESGQLVSDSRCTQAFVTGETKVVAYEVVDVGSPEPRLDARLKVKHHGKVTTLDLSVPGIRKAKGHAPRGPLASDLVPLAPVMAMAFLSVGGLWGARSRLRKR